MTYVTAGDPDLTRSARRRARRSRAAARTSSKSACRFRIRSPTDPRFSAPRSARSRPAAISATIPRSRAQPFARTSPRRSCCSPTSIPCCAWASDAFVGARGRRGRRRRAPARSADRRIRGDARGARRARHRSDLSRQSDDDRCAAGGGGAAGPRVSVRHFAARCDRRARPSVAATAAPLVAADPRGDDAAGRPGIWHFPPGACRGSDRVSPMRRSSAARSCRSSARPPGAAPRSATPWRRS